jgi:hypothetical protein
MEITGTIQKGHVTLLIVAPLNGQCKMETLNFLTAMFTYC